MAESYKRRRFYIDPEIQFPLIVSLILLITIQGFLVGWGFYKAIAIAKDWQRPDQMLQFFKALALTIVPIVLVNFLVGTYLSHKVAGPLYKMRRTMSEIARGNLEGEVLLRRGDLLQSCALDFNEMMQTLRRLIYRDHKHADEANLILSECETWLAKRKSLPAGEREELQKLLKDAKSRLSVINTHFLKGREETELQAEASPAAAPAEEKA